jgi:hypothetical protein
MARRQRRWFGIVALCSVAVIGCATGGMADPDADGIFDDVEKPTDDTGKKGVDTGEGEDAVVGDDVGSELDSGAPTDSGGADTGPMDAGPMDTGPTDTGPRDTGPMDTGPVDTGPMDTGPVDTGPIDTGPVDTGPRDTGPVDTGPRDTGTPDTGSERTITCPLPIGTTTCTGSRACCFTFFGGIPAGCGCSQVGGLVCLPCS